jgi:uncharacterized membrane protein
MSRISVTENRALMTQARQSLKEKWGLTIGSFIVFIFVTSGIHIIPVAGGIISLLISGPMAVGWAIFALAAARDHNPRLELIFNGFQTFGTALAAYLLVGLFVLLWSLLLIVPGIIAALAYSQVFYILADNRMTGPLEAIRRSKEMMRGNKWKFFCLALRFVGWALLCILTLGVGFLWLFPYASVSAAKFYDDIRDDVPASTEEMMNPAF